jgi:MtN3 and saliva related transmembrane protein
MDWIAVLGFAAALCSTVSFVPQAYRIVKTRDTSSISTRMYLITCLGFVLWLGYGVALGQWPLIVTNSICLALASFILFMKVSPRQTVDKVAETLTPDTNS